MYIPSCVRGESENLLVVCNFTDRTISYQVKEYLNGAEGKLVISNYEDAAATVTDELVLPPYGAYMYISFNDRKYRW